MRIVGLTGGTGSGKSRAGRLFAHHGIPVIDADAVGHELLAPGGAGVEPVVEVFGEAIVTDGVVDRTKLGSVVFGDEDARQRLNAIIHPLILHTIAERCAKFAEEGQPTVLIDAALLAERGERDAWLDGLILVTCPPAIRLRRLVEHRGLTPEEAQQRIDAQGDPDRKIALAEWIIENDGTLKMLQQRVDELARELDAHAQDDQKM